LRREKIIFVSEKVERIEKIVTLMGGFGGRKFWQLIEKEKKPLNDLKFKKVMTLRQDRFLLNYYNSIVSLYFYEKFFF
jgi:hypothetical protein